MVDGWLLMVDGRWMPGINVSLSQRELTRRREHKAKAELAGKTDRVMQLRQEIAENERQLDMAQVRTVSTTAVCSILTESNIIRKTLKKYQGL